MCAIVGFYRRRARRLGPALLALLMVYSAVTVVRWPLGLVVRHLVFPLTWTSNLAIAAYGEGFIGHGLGHLWSLAAEEQFYLLWPLLVILIPSRKLLVALLTAGALMTVYLQVDHPMSLLLAQYGPSRSAASLMLGCLAAFTYAAGKHRHVTRLWPVAVAIGAVAVVWTPTYVWFGWQTLFSLAAAVVLLAALDRSWRALTNRVTVYVGKLSYSLYLWHIPILVAFGAGSIAADFSIIGLAFGAAALSYRFVEKPFRQRRRRDRLVVAPVGA